MKKYIRYFLLVLAVILNSLGISAFAAEGSVADSARLDAVLVIDASGSMQQTDPKKLGLEGVKLFVDMLSSSGNQVGIVSYGSEVDQTYPMTRIESLDDKNKVKSFVDKISRNLEYTDITSGLGKAVTMLDQRDRQNGGSPVIIVFTDGNNAIGGIKNRTDKDIAKDLDNDISKAQAGGYPVYTIGLNDNGKLNEAYLKNISDQTGGLAFATKDPDELPDILTQIFAAHSNLKVQSLPTMVGTGDFEEIKVNIPNENVLEANIAATSSNPVAFKLKDPDGKEVAIPSDGVTQQGSSAYQLLKISKPAEGDWTLYVKGVSGDRVNIDLVYNYDIDVVMEQLSSDTFKKGDMLDVSAYFSIQGKAVSDDALYQNATASVVLKDEAGKETKKPLSVSDQKFTGNCKLKTEGSFEVYVLVEDTSYTRKSTPVTITVGKKGAGNDAGSQEKKHKTPKNAAGKILIIAIVILGAAGIWIILKKLKDAQRPLVGQMVVEIRDNTTGKLTPPQYKKLNIFKGKVSLYALLQFNEEYKAAEKIIFRSAPSDKVILFNQSGYVIERAGRALRTEGGLELKKGDRLNINMADCGVTIQLEYLL